VSGLFNSELACEKKIVSVGCGLNFFFQLIATLDCNDDHEMINVEEFEGVLRRHIDK